MTAPDHRQLCKLIGQTVMLDGEHCQIVEVLEDGPSLVVECVHAEQSIQTNQFGDGNRRVIRNKNIPVFRSADQDELHPLFEQLWRSINAS